MTCRVLQLSLVAHFGTSGVLTFEFVFLYLFSLTLFAVAASSSNANKMDHPAPDWDLLQSHLPIDRVDWNKVRVYLFDRFTSPPSSFLNRQGHTLVTNAEPHQACDHLHFRPCPSFMDTNYHPEFLLHGRGSVVWTPRTWTCRAFQRRTDLHRHSHLPTSGLPPTPSTRLGAFGTRGIPDVDHDRAQRPMVFDLQRAAKFQWPKATLDRPLPRYPPLPFLPGIPGPSSL